MASESGRLALFIPFFFRVSNDNGDDPRREPATERESNRGPGEIRVVLVNPLNRTFIVVEGIARVDALFGGLETKPEHSPASSASIEAMPEVEIGEDLDCAICLDGMKVAKEMPCKHRFHGDCVEKWLRIHGSCPVCRFQMPVDEQIQKRCSGGDGDDDGNNGGLERDHGNVTLEYSNHSSNQEPENHQNSDQ